MQWDCFTFALPFYCDHLSTVRYELIFVCYFDSQDVILFQKIFKEIFCWNVVLFWEDDTFVL